MSSCVREWNLGQLKKMIKESPRFETIYSLTLNKLKKNKKKELTNQEIIINSLAYNSNFKISIISNKNFKKYFCYHFRIINAMNTKHLIALNRQ